MVNRQASRRLRDGGGAIVNFSSSVVGLALPTYAVYTSNRGCSRGDDIRARQGGELRGRDITVNAVAPRGTLILPVAPATSPTLSRISWSGEDGHGVNGQVIRIGAGPT